MQTIYGGLVNQYLSDNWCPIKIWRTLQIRMVIRFWWSKTRSDKHPKSAPSTFVDSRLVALYVRTSENERQCKVRRFGGWCCWEDLLPYQVFFHIYLSSSSLNLKFAFSFFLNEILLVHTVCCPIPLGGFTSRKDNVDINTKKNKKQKHPGTQQGTGMACTARPWSTSMPPASWWMARFPFENMNKANGNINQLN